MRIRMSRRIAWSLGAAGVLATACIAAGAFADEQKKPAPAAPAQHAAPAPAAHAPNAPAGGGAGSRGPTMGGNTEGHGPTTGGGSTTAGHGPTTGGAAGHGITTSNPGGARAAGPTTGGNKPGAGDNREREHKPGTDARDARSGAASQDHGTQAEHGTQSGHRTQDAGHGSAFAGHPAPAGSHELRAANGAAIRTRADGSRSDIHDPKRGMDIHHSLSGNRRTTVERPDHTRVVAERGGRGYVQHPYVFHGHEFGHRTYFVNGRAYDRFYGRYPYNGVYLDVYAPARFYPYGFYGYAYAPWVAPVPYAWGWGGAPWYGYYGAYYAPYPVYPAPAFWLADFVIAASLQAAFIAQASADMGPAPATAPEWLFARSIADLLVDAAQADAKPAMTPEVKQMVAEEIKGLVQLEGTEAQANAARQDPDPAKDSVAQLLSDNRPHVFVAGVDLDLVTGAGTECAFSQGDVVKVAGAPAGGANTVSATVLASKGGKECAVPSTVTVAIADLQDMHNHMREQVDDGLTELQTKQGKAGGLPAAPADAAGAPSPAGFAAGAPPPDASAGSEIRQQSNDADAAEREASATASPGPAPGAGTSATIAAGQSIDQVTAALGNPTKIIDLGAKKIYTYPDLKVTFMNGKVANVE
jgi:hypothetical protein